MAIAAGVMRAVRPTKTALLNKSKKAENQAQTRPPLGGFFWWFILGVLLLKDLLDLVFALVGFLLATTGIGTVITTILTIIGGIVAFIAASIQVIYFAVNGVPIFRLAGKMSVQAFAEVVPFANLLPMTSLIFIYTTIRENMKRKRRAAS